MPKKAKKEEKELYDKDKVSKALDNLLGGVGEASSEEEENTKIQKADKKKGGDYKAEEDEPTNADVEEQPEDDDDMDDDDEPTMKKGKSKKMKKAKMKKAMAARNNFTEDDDDLFDAKKEIKVLRKSLSSSIAKQGENTAIVMKAVLERLDSFEAAMQEFGNEPGIRKAATRLSARNRFTAEGKDEDTLQKAAVNELGEGAKVLDVSQEGGRKKLLDLMDTASIGPDGKITDPTIAKAMGQVELGFNNALTPAIVQRLEKATKTKIVTTGE